jgi:hypothetical protein
VILSGDKMYTIWNEKTRLWWSNEIGWVDTGADIFSRKERENFNLPIDGRWYNLTTGELE